MTSYYNRRVGSVRPSHLMFTAGIGSLVDLPNFSVLVKGLDSWTYEGLPGDYVIDEPRLRTAVNRSLQLYGNAQVTELRSAPWAEGADTRPKDWPAQGVGVPVTPFPQWLRCTACNVLAAVDSDTFEFRNGNPRAPHEAKFIHDCRRGRLKPLAVAARFTLACTDGHLDEFPYIPFVHHGNPCTKAPRPQLRMRDHGGNQAANVTIQCISCKKKRNIRDAMGERGAANLPRCRGRHPHLGTYADGGCEQEATLMVAGASNQWFPVTLSALALPPNRTADVVRLVEERWEELKAITTRELYDAISSLPQYRYLKEYEAQDLIDAVAARKAALDGRPSEAPAGPVDLLSPEWAVLSAPRPPQATSDFTLVEVDDVPPAVTGLFSHVRQVERLREARALVAFTRLDAPDRESPEIAEEVRLFRSSPGWVPASEVRGEGIFLRVRQDLLADWVARVEKTPVLAAHREAFARFRTNRKSDRITGEFEPMAGWPGEAYLALHTLSHALIRTIALECGYSSASLAERIYADTAEERRSGILIYTAAPDSEGTLGGLVTLAESPDFERILRRALRDAAHCSSDPLCAERLPKYPADYLHGAACHVCMFVSETTCERGNRFLDRRFLVPLEDDSDLVLTPAGLLA
ncbi:DUF1998 domain-containing protein [Streptomyces aculeolatus]|uniref:DUF1998 domain-containing protein n=1 Tax=Streptomyces aculeolatus TaxID=270689 RepID=UPI001CEC395B|nr:DUF1998 domain-containing protein [Streptomyces aculeolatus]